MAAVKLSSCVGQVCCRGWRSKETAGYRDLRAQDVDDDVAMKTPAKPKARVSAALLIWRILL